MEYRSQLGIVLNAIVLNQPISEAAEFLNHSRSMHTAYREVITIVDHTVAAEGTDVSVPFRNKDRFSIPLYYIY